MNHILTKQLELHSNEYTFTVLSFCRCLLFFALLWFFFPMVSPVSSLLFDWRPGFGAVLGLRSFQSAFPYAVSEKFIAKIIYEAINEALG